MMDSQLNLRAAFPDIPDAVYQGLMQAARSVSEAQKPRRRPLRLVLAAALVLALMMAAAYAIFPDQVARFFGRQYGKNSQDWLAQGQVATPADSLELAGQIFTLEEVVYRNQGLYGLVRVHGDKARQAQISVNQIAVDGGPPLHPAVVGLDEELQADGSVLLSFEVSDGLAVGDGNVFLLLLQASVDGQTKDWTVSVQPAPPAPQDLKERPPEQSPADAEPGYDLILPEEYEKNGSLPVYSAQLRDFGTQIQPELFNQSGIKERGQYRVVFHDEAVLDWSPETLSYQEYSGSYEQRHQSDSGLITHTSPKPTLAQAAASFASMVRSGWPDARHWQGISLQKTALAQISLHQAQAILEERLQALGLTGYSLAYALDMDSERIASLGAIYNKLRAENPLWNGPEMDYKQAGPADEGYYLYYFNGITTDEQYFVVSAFVTNRGIVSLQVRDLLIKGEALYTPDRLLSAAEVIARLPGEIAQSRFPEMGLKQVLSAQLTYSIRRHADGSLVFTPAWQIIYLNTENTSYTDYALFDATDGRLLNARFL